MSYILEALKKSQRDRELGQVPDLTSETCSDSAEVAHKSGASPWIIGSVVIALLAMLIALYALFWHQLPIPPSAETPINPTVALQPPVVAPVVTKAESRTMPAADAKPSTISSAPSKTPETTMLEADKIPPPVDKGKSRNERPEVEKIRQEYAEILQREQQRSKQPPVAPKPVRTPVKAAPQPAPVTEAVKTTHPAVYELPADVLSRLPARNIMLQSYSEDPAQRFVIMNSAKLYQGERTVDNLQIVEIRTDGLLLEFEGYRFFQAR